MAGQLPPIRQSLGIWEKYHIQHPVRYPKKLVDRRRANEIKISVLEYDSSQASVVFHLAITCNRGAIEDGDQKWGSKEAVPRRRRP